MKMQRKWMKIAGCFLLVAGLWLTGCKEENPQESLYAMKTSFVGDNSSVSHIVGAVTYPQGAVCDKIEIQSVQEPYGLTVYLQTENTLEEDELLPQAVVCLALIENLGVVQYVNAADETLIAQFEREPVDALLEAEGQKSCAELGNDEAAFEAYIESAQL